MSPTKSIYAVEAQNGMLKIGVSASPKSRAAAIHAHSPIPCRLIATWPGTTKEEFALHRRFAAYRGHSEWFRIEGDLAEFVREVFGRGLDEVECWGGPDPLDREEKRRLLSAKQSAAIKAAWAYARLHPHKTGYRPRLRPTPDLQAAS